jgi:hypothetical protein
VLGDALCRGLSPRRRGRSGRPPGHGRLATAFAALGPDHASRKDGVAGVPAAANPSPRGTGHGDMRLAGLSPLLGHDAPGRRGHQAADGRETPAPVEARERARVSGASPGAPPGAGSGLVRATAWPCPRRWYPGPLHEARSGLRVSRASGAIRAEQTQPQGPPQRAAGCRCCPSPTAAPATQAHAPQLAEAGTAQGCATRGVACVVRQEQQLVGYRGTGCGKPSRPELWGGRRVTGAFTWKR